MSHAGGEESVAYLSAGTASHSLRSTHLPTPLCALESHADPYFFDVEAYATIDPAVTEMRSVPSGAATKRYISCRSSDRILAVRGVAAFGDTEGAEPAQSKAAGSLWNFGGAWEFF